MREIQLHSRKYLNLVALVDDEDYERVNALRWNPHWNPGTQSFYAVSLSGPVNARKGISMGPFVMGTTYQGRIVLCDHRNHDTLDNQKSNLRVANNSQNSANSRPSRRSTSGYRGVFPAKGKRPWKAAIKKDGALYHLGYHFTAEDAAKAYDEAAKKYHGEFARLNF